MPSVLVWLAMAASAGAQPARDVLAAEVRRVRAEAERVLTDELRGAVSIRLDRAAAALAARRYWLALYEIEGPWEMTAAFALVREHERVKDLAGFVERWQAIGEPSIRASAPSSSRPLLVEALATAAEARGPVLYRASRPYADDADVASGFYYLGEAKAVGAFAAFARAMGWPVAPVAPALRSLMPDLETLDAEMTKAYEGMDRSEHPEWIVASVTLKRARALSDAGREAGALIEYLLARYRFAPLRRPRLDATASAASANELRDKLRGLRTAFSDDVDHSVALLFVEMAEAALDSATEAARRNAAFIVDDVLPAYQAALEPAPSRETTANQAAVTITLVRWPFT